MTGAVHDTVGAGLGLGLAGVGVGGGSDWAGGRVGPGGGPGAGPRRASPPRKPSLAAAAVAAEAAPGAGAKIRPGAGPGWVSGTCRGLGQGLRGRRGGPGSAPRPGPGWGRAGRVGCSRGGREGGRGLAAAQGCRGPSRSGAAGSREELPEGPPPRWFWRPGRGGPNLKGRLSLRLSESVVGGLRSLSGWIVRARE